MKSNLALLASGFIACTASCPSTSTPDGTSVGSIAEQAQLRISAFHHGHQTATNLLRVVYFHAKDAEPLRDWQDRLDRVMSDISDFYRDGMQQGGFVNEGLPLEKKHGHLVIHMVRGKKPSSGYEHESGAETEAEMRQALAGKIDFDREHVLAFYGLCRKERDGRYVFTAPYYGSGSAQHGLAHAADCELLDPLLLTETNRHIVFTEHYYARMEHTIARFNSWYLGGVAHELGHALGLPHDAGSPSEQSPHGTSLMGGGNLTYREDRWGGQAPSYLSLATALRLASNPLITRSNRDRWTPLDGKISDLHFVAEKGVLKVSGRVSGNVEAYAIIGYLLPASARSDHASRTYPSLVEAGVFKLEITGLRAGRYHLRLASCHLNGSCSNTPLEFQCNDAGVPDTATLEKK